MAQSPTVRRLQLGRELRRLRESAAVPREAAAEELECDVSKISKIETGKQTLQAAEVRALLRLYGCEGEEAEQVLAVAREARKRESHRVPEWVRAFVGLEAEAVEIKKFEIELVPGLFQTEAYTRAVTHAADPTRNPGEVDRLVAIRQERQARLFGDGPPQLWVVLNEAVIRRLVGGRDVMAEQLGRLRELADLPTVSLQVLPFGAGAHAAMGSSFSILRLPDPGGQVVYLEDLWSAEYVDRESQVAAYNQVFDRLCTTAFDAAETKTLIERAMGESDDRSGGRRLA
ncbi:helix-turn-helix domain-containing protein [Pseudonocardia sp. DSM 110487]|uniref:helix-turn-helix domain-containing protein n=1 Tax=Pseudonocardia sp. DSM 110487 TaxID=2865833 RepID=UPI001C69EBFA|nr:helix-turn-helix transcriptional regulator [Pseudonocardia sp. DSM 110487]QYN36487.1 helix-turn-helix domain-containing protein [Pseudonocardia sp. DSM 110487]